MEAKFETKWNSARSRFYLKHFHHIAGLYQRIDSRVYIYIYIRDIHIYIYEIYIYYLLFIYYSILWNIDLPFTITICVRYKILYNLYNSTIELLWNVRIIYPRFHLSIFDESLRTCVKDGQRMQSFPLLYTRVSCLFFFFEARRVKLVLRF